MSRSSGSDGAQRVQGDASPQGPRVGAVRDGRRRKGSPMPSARRTSIMVLVIGLSAVVVLGLGAVWVRPMGESMRMRSGLEVDAWRVGQGAPEILAAQDSVRVGDMIQISVTADVPTRVGAWTRDGSGRVRSWFGPEGAVVEPGEGVVVDRTGPFDARPGTLFIAVQVCPRDHPIGGDPWSQSTPPARCRPYLWTLNR